MTQARRQIVSLESTPYYHCVSRCVRRAFLCGQDEYSGKDFSHRRAWVESRLAELTQAFTIEVCAYAVMSNHYHVVLYVDKAKSESISDEEVVSRWLSLFTGSSLAQRFNDGEKLEQKELTALGKDILKWRKNLCSISWFMRCINEPLARKANAEDKVTGRFWEGRFKSQALLEERALLACMSYVDLNPIRAGIADSLETCDFTSIKKRLSIESNDVSSNQSASPTRPLHLSLFKQNAPTTEHHIDFTFDDYVELLRWSSAIKVEKQRFQKSSVPGAVKKLKLNAKTFLTLTDDFEALFQSLVGGERAMSKFVKINHENIKRRANLSTNKKIFGK